MEHDSDPLVDQARAGDREAFRQLVMDHSQAAFRVAYRILGDEAAAEDAVQEAFLSAHRKLQSFDGQARFSTWLHRITVNQAIDQRRKTRRRHESTSLHDLEDPATPFAAPASDAPQPDRLLASRQVGEAARRSLEGLTALERTAFVLRHVEGCSIAEIGAVLDLQPSATKQAIFRAVKKMRQALDPWVSIRHEAVT